MLRVVVQMAEQLQQFLDACIQGVHTVFPLTARKGVPGMDGQNFQLAVRQLEPAMLCELLHDPLAGEVPLSSSDRELIATKFFVGGASFNSLQSTASDSRRIEFKLEFKTRQEQHDKQKNPPKEVDDALLKLALDPKERCPLLDR